MSKTQRAEQRRVISIDIDEENENSADNDDKETKEKLKLEIRLLKLYISQKINGDTMSFKDIRKPQIGNAPGRSRGNSSQLVDIELEIKNDLFTMAGLCCRRMDDSFIFAFRSFENGLHSTKNWIELFKFDEQWKLLKWIMPLSVDVAVIFDKYTIDSAASMKLFLKECKHTIDCYYRREYEFTKLKDFLVDLGSSRVSLETNYAYTRITVHLIKAVCKSREEARYIIVLFEYKKQEARPWKVIFDCEGESPLSTDETKALRVLFRKVKEQGLKEAMEEILTSDGSPFFSKEDSHDNSIIYDNAEENSDGEISFMKILKKDRKPKHQTQRKIPSKNDENDNEVSEADEDDRRENDMSIIDVSDRSNAQSNEEEDVSLIDIRSKTVKKKSKKAPSPKRKLLQKSKADEKSKISQGTRKKSLPSENRNDNVSSCGENDGKTIKFIVPEIFRPKGKQQKGFLEEINAADMEMQKPGKKIKKTRNSGRKTRHPAENSAETSGNRSRVKLMCSTPIVGRATTNLSTVAEENISAIGKGNLMIIAPEITEIEKIQDTSTLHDDSDDSNLDETKDITRVEKSQRELLKELQAVKDNATVAKKTGKRKATSSAGGKTKVARK